MSNLTVGMITVLNYTNTYEPKWVKIKSILANDHLATVYMQNKDGTDWITDHHFCVSTKSLGFREILPKLPPPTFCVSPIVNNTKTHYTHYSTRNKSIRKKLKFSVLCIAIYVLVQTFLRYEQKHLIEK